MAASMDDDFCLRWNDHHKLIWTTMERLINSQNMTDVTLSLANGHRYKAHRLVLSACSPYFEDLFSNHDPRALAVVYLKGINPFHMQLLLQYMYKGEVNVEESEIFSLLDAAKDLQIKGLTEAAEKMCMQRQSKVKEEEVEPSFQGVEEEEEIAAEGAEEEGVSPQALLPETSSSLIDTPPPPHLPKSPRKVPPSVPLKKASSSGDAVCLECGKTFTHRWKLDRHSTTHSGIQRFVCSICDRRFSHQASAARHIKNVHKETNTGYLINKLDENAFTNNVEEMCQGD